MIIFVTSKLELIHSHLNHVLKSYYNTTLLSAAAFTQDGDLIDIASDIQMINPNNTKLNLMDSGIKHFIQSTNTIDLSEKDTVIHEVDANIFVIIAPVIVESKIICYLMSEPFLISSIQSIMRKNLYEELKSSLTHIHTYEDFQRIQFIKKSRLNYLGQLFFHLMTDAIYIGNQHFSPSIKMTETRWGKTLPVEAFEQTNQFVNIPVVEAVASHLVQLSFDNAIQAFSNHYIFQSTHIINICPLRMAQYQAISFVVCLQYALGREIKGINALLNVATQNCVRALHMITCFKQIQDCIEKVFRDYLEIIVDMPSVCKSKSINIAMEYIHSHYMKPIRLSDVAGSIPMNESYFSNQFKIEMGVTFNSYLSGYRVKQATKLLDTTDLTITEAALAVGFENTNYFSTVFKKYTGITARDYSRK